MKTKNNKYAKYHSKLKIKKKINQGTRNLASKRVIFPLPTYLAFNYLTVPDFF